MLLFIQYYIWSTIHVVRYMYSTNYIVQFFYNIVEGEIWINVLLLLCTYYIVLDLLEWFPPKRNPNTAFKTMHMYLTGGLNAGNGNEAVLYYYLSIKWKVHTIRILVMCVSKYSKFVHSSGILRFMPDEIT